MKRHVYVGGFDFDKHGVNFGLLCDRRKDRQIAANSVAKEDLVFTIFEFETGLKKEIAVTYPAGKKVEKKTAIELKKKIAKSDYAPREYLGKVFANAFKDGQTDKMSILDVYEEIQQIGATGAGSIVEFSLFSHAGHSGPILVNSFDTKVGDQASNERDPYDMDPRTGKDFVSPTMDPNAELPLFCQAFNPAGLIWIWGCNAPPSVHDLLVAVARVAGLGPTDGEKLLTFRYLTAAARGLLEQNLKAYVEVSKTTKQVSIKFKWIQYLLCRLLGGTYMHRIAAVTKLRTLGAPLGAGANYDPKGSWLPLMRVDPARASHATFYKNLFGMKTDHEGRGYLEYPPVFPCPKPPP